MHVERLLKSKQECDFPPAVLRLSSLGTCRISERLPNDFCGALSILSKTDKRKAYYFDVTIQHGKHKVRFILATSKIMVILV